MNSRKQLAFVRNWVLGSVRARLPCEDRSLCRVSSVSGDGIGHNLCHCF